MGSKRCAKYGARDRISCSTLACFHVQQPSLTGLIAPKTCGVTSIFRLAGWYQKEMGHNDVKADGTLIGESCCKRRLLEWKSKCKSNFPASRFQTPTRTESPLSVHLTIHAQQRNATCKGSKSLLELTKEFRTSCKELNSAIWNLRVGRGAKKKKKRGEERRKE